METHGEMRRGSRSKESAIWTAMLQRCLNPSCKSYPRYGGRGITVCERWLGKSGLANFIADMGRKPEGKSLDREDNNGPYSPENCRWATRAEQQRNRECNVMVTLLGRGGLPETRCVTEWADVLNLNIKTIRKRMNQFGWSPERAILEPVITGRRGLLVSIGRDAKTIAEWSKVSGVPRETIRERLKDGWDAKAAVFSPVQNRGPRRKK